MLDRIRQIKRKKQGEQKIISRALLCIMLILFSAITAFAATSFVETEVECDGTSVRVTSLSNDPYDIISLAGITVERDDTVVLDGFDEPAVQNAISVIKPHNVTVKDGKEAVGTFIVGGTVADALKKAAVQLGKYDTVSPQADTQITDDMTVKVNRAFKVKIQADGKTKTYYATSDITVNELLKRENIELSEYDELNYKGNKKVKENMKLIINRVEYEMEAVEAVQKYETQKEYSDDMYVGEFKIKREGVNGKKTDYYFIKYVDSKKADRIYGMSVIAENPIDKIVVYGTKPYSYPISPNAKIISELTPTMDIELDETGRPLNYKKVITGKATAYCGGGITSTGRKAMPGRVAVNPKQIPYGTKMYIVSSDGKYVYGYCEASDTGGFAKRGSATVDLYMHSYSACMQFGRRSVEIYILE